MSAALSLPAIVAVPELSFVEIDRRLAAAGWLLGAESQEPPLVPGEPHWCEFWRRDSDDRIAYTFNPVVGLRVLSVAGPDAVDTRLEVAAAVPHLDSVAVRALLDRDDERALLLGLLAAGATHDVTLLDLVQALEQHPEPKVAAAATHARDQILPGPVAAAIDLLTTAKHLHPDRSALFAFYGGPEQRRQILRWLVHDFEAANPSIEEVLRSGLADADPEVRITAVLAAARLGTTGVARAVADASLPETTAEGADPRERRLYHRLRDAVVKYLGARAAGTLPATPREQWPALYQLLSGPVPVADDMTLLVHALTTPLELGEPPSPGRGVMVDGLRWRLERSGLALAALAPVPHWLGYAGRAGAPPGPVANPLRRATPARGLFIGQVPLTETTATSAGNRDAPLLVTRYEADRVLARVAASDGIALRLPTADEWEMAMRGPDGRLFPWGSNLAPTARGANSPWRVAPARTLEWTADAEDEAPVVVGGDRFEPAALRRRAEPGTRAAVRAVVEPT